MTGKFGELTQGLNYKSHGMIIFWSLDLFRKGLLALVVVFASEILWLQLAGLLYTSTAMMVTIGYSNARRTAFDRRMDHFNEIKLIVVTYHVMMFTGFVPNAETKWMIGYSCCLALVIGILVNSINVVVSPIRKTKKRIKIWLAKRDCKEQKEDRKVF